MEWQCTGDAVRQRLAVDSDGSGSRHRHRQHSFGDGKLDLAVVNQRHSGAVFILLGDGTGNFTLAASPGTGGFSLSVAVGDFNGDGKLDLAVANAGGNTASILLQGRFPLVSLSPTSVTFGTQLVLTTSYPQLVILTNTGSARLDISSIVASPNFTQKNDCGSHRKVGALCTIEIRFNPHAVGTITGTITITDNASNSPQIIPLTGVGTAVTLLPSSLDFGNQPVGSTSQPQTVTLTNYANRALSISGGELTGNNPGAFTLQNTTCGRSLPAGGSCTVSIAFAPKTAGPKTATLEVRDNGGASPQTVLLTGSGT